jgi:broad specificity phosphatase PhoE
MIPQGFWLTSQVLCFASRDARVYRFVTATTFIFVRHAESGGVHDVLVGRNDKVSLTERGTLQAQRIADSLLIHPIGMVVSSPQLRARQTAETIAGLQQKPIATDNAFDECDFGEWTGLPFSELESRREWKTFNRLRSIQGPPGGESLRQVQHRAISGVLRLLHSAAHGKAIVIASHADVIRSVISFFSGAPLDLFLRFRIDPASISIIQISEYGPEIHCLNQCPAAVAD